ncbi:MAG: right-handed parallel beta-helix repeat-containing protein, partial [Anaerolineae bacterium]|nr:right-handed parallel beta-helix repeat-containing protein [Anaerolineae bacterium]
TQDIVTSVDGTCIHVGAGNVTFDGQGYTIRNTATGAETDIAINVNAKANVTVTGVTLDDWGTGIRLYQATGARVLTNTVTDGGVGLQLVGTDNGLIAGNAITQSTTGVWMYGSDNNNFTQNRFCKQTKRDIEMSGTSTGNVRSGNTCDAIYNWNGDGGLSSCTSTCTPLTTTSCASPTACAGKLNGDYGKVTLTGNVTPPGGITVTGNHVTLDCANHEIIGSGSGAGLSFEDRIGVHVENCRIHGFSTGIEVRSSGMSKLYTNEIYSNTTGIAVLQTDPTLKPLQNILDHNTIYGNASYGINLTNAQDSIVQGNGLYQNGQYDLWVAGECDNYIDSSSGVRYVYDQSGVTVTGSGNDEVILCNVDNSVVRDMAINNGVDNNNGILIIDSSETTVQGIAMDHSRGILVVGSDSITVTNNTITDSAADGIAYDGSPDGTVISNSVRTSAGYGVAIRGLSHGADVISNTVGANRSSTAGGNIGGILVEDSNNVAVRDNWVRRNTGEGIAVESSSGTTVSNNTVRGNLYGLYLNNQVSGVTVNNNGFCYSTGKDVYSNAGAGATGDNNTCSQLYSWADTGETSRCTNECVGWYNRNWGFSFHNPTVDDLSWSRYEDTFGEDEVEITVKICAGLPICIPFKCWCAGKMIDIGTGIPEPVAAILYGAAYRDLGEPGTCYGVSGNSLAFFNYDDHPANYLAGATTVPDLKADSTFGGYSLTESREIVHGSQMSTEAISIFLSALATGGDDANTVLNAARNGLANGQMGTVSIKDGLTTGHVLNYDTVVDEAGNTSRIYVYDSNKEGFVTNLVDDPTQFPAIVVDRAANDWNYQHGSSTWGDDSIFNMPYAALNRSDWTLPLSVNGIINMVFGSGAKAGVEDMSGNLLGYDDAGTPHEEIPGAMGYPIWGATDASDLPARLLVQPGDYDIHIYGGSGPYTGTLVGLNGAYVLESIPASVTTRDELEFRIVNGNAQHNELAIMTSDAWKPVTTTWTRGSDPSGDRRTYRITGELNNLSKIWIKTLPDLSGAVVANRGTVTVTYSLEISNEMVREGVPTPSGAPTLVVGPFSVAPGETDAIVPDDWGDLAGATAVVTTSICGDHIQGPGEDSVNCPDDAGPPKECVEPYDDMVIAADTLLCSGTYELPDEGEPGVLIVEPDGVTLDCNGAVLMGGGSGIGIRGLNGNGITIIGCTVAHYTEGIHLDGVSNGTVAQSVLMANAEWGLHASGVSGLSTTQLYVADNGNGLLLEGADGATLEQVTVCPNIGTDIAAWESFNLTGKENACDITEGWQDAGFEACTYACSVPVTRRVYLPLVLR